MALPIPAWPDQKSPEGMMLVGRALSIVSAWKAYGVGNASALGMLGCAGGEYEDVHPNGLGDWMLDGLRLPWAPT